MSEHGEFMWIELGVTNGQGRAACTVSESLYAGLLEELDVERLEDADPNVFRQLVRLALSEELVDMQESDAPGSTSLGIIGQNEGDPEFTEISSSDVGVEMMKRLAPRFTEEQATLLDPTYSPVAFELRVCRDKPSLEAVRAAECVLSLVLEPSDLA